MLLALTSRNTPWTPFQRRTWLAEQRRKHHRSPAQPEPASLLTGLQGYYDFADGSLTSHGVMDDLFLTSDTGGPLWIDTDNYGRSFFNGSGGAMLEGGGYSITSYPFTFTCWMMRDEYTYTEVPPFALFSYDVNHAQVELAYYDADNIWAYLGDANRSGLCWFGSLGFGLADNVFHQCTLVFTANSVATYVDGQLTGTFAHTTPCPNLNKLSLGWRWIDWFRQRGPLKVGNIGIWNRALTADDVTQLYNGGLGLDYASL